jgi:hypothetical protein
VCNRKKAALAHVGRVHTCHIYYTTWGVAAEAAALRVYCMACGADQQAETVPAQKCKQTIVQLYCINNCIATCGEMFRMLNRDLSSNICTDHISHDNQQAAAAAAAV